MSDRTRGAVLLAALAAFVCTILAANYVTTEHGLVPVGFGLAATAGTYFAGVAFVLRDLIHDTGGRVAVAAAIVTGAALSYAVSDPHIATASAVAFLLSEVADWCVYEPLRGRGWVRAAIASNIVGAIVDTFLFLWIAGFGIAAPIVEGQLVGKLTVTAVVVALVLAVVTLTRGRRNVTA